MHMLSRALAALAAVPVLAFASCQSPPRPPAQAPQLDQAGDFDAVLDAAWTGTSHPPGAAIAVYTPQGVYVRALGVTDVATGERATPDTAFYIASTTKAFT